MDSEDEHFIMEFLATCASSFMMCLSHLCTYGWVAWVLVA